MRNLCCFIILLIATLTGCISQKSSQNLPCNRKTIGQIMSAFCFLKQLGATGMLSGISTNDQTSVGVAYPDPCDQLGTSADLILRATQEKTPDTIYWFSVSKENSSTNWIINKQWATDFKGNILVSELPLPSPECQATANLTALNSPKFKHAMKRILK